MVFQVWVSWDKDFKGQEINQVPIQRGRLMPG